MINQLVDKFGRTHTYLRISVTDRCNLRCAYCMPHEGINWRQSSEILSYEEIIRIAKVFVSLGINKIRITGGEPLMRNNIEWLIKQLSLLDGVNTIAMTTNATVLAGKAQLLKECGLTALNISIDTFKKDRFYQISHRDCLDSVMSGIQEALKIGFESLKLNMVVMAGVNDDELIDFVDFAYNKEINVRFIEYMPFRGTDWKTEEVITFAQMKSVIEKKYKLIAISTEPNTVAKDFQIENGTGTVSFITSMSESFCSTCNRLRLTADGSVKSCLFFPAEINLRNAMRKGITDAELAEMIFYSLSLKPEMHPPPEEIAIAENRAMIEIGG